MQAGAETIRAGLFSSTMIPGLETMRTFRTSVICLFSTGWLAASMSASGQDSRDNSCRGIAGHNSLDLKSAPAAATQTPPPEITLNGIMTVFGGKSALFKVELPQGAGKQSYFLSEGEQAAGIQLLSVDAQACSIKVSNHGVLQVIALCQPPRLATWGTAAASAGGVSGINLRANQGISQEGGSTAGGENPGVVGQFNQPGYVGGAGNSGSSANNTDNTGSKNTGTANSSAADAGATTDAGAQKEEPFWVRASKEFEQLRTQTADAVRSGVNEPLPLTPLTPAGTAPELIGPDRAWFYND
jgi:hypothetical protein